MRKALLTASLLCVGATAAQAGDIDSLDSLTQSQFLAFSEDLGAAVNYKAVSPAEPLGISGFDIGLEATNTIIENTAAFDVACGGCGDDSLTIPKLHLHKGLPASLDIGLVLASVPNSNIKLSGMELRYAFLEGGVASPALALRGSYSRLDGVDQLAMESKALELTISKGLAMFTPYAGIGTSWVSSRPDSSTGLDDESFTQSKYYIGLNLNLGVTNLAFEGDRTGESDSFSAKLGFRF
jgi:hypothetical protein